MKRFQYSMTQSMTTVSVRDTHSATMIATSIASTSRAMAPAETRLRYSVATALASTSFSPTFRRVRKVDGLLCWRERSKNSSMLAVCPAVTISDAPWWSASSNARSAADPAAGKVIAPTPRS